VVVPEDHDWPPADDFLPLLLGPIDDLNSGNKFKFISLEEGTRTGEIQDPTSPDNGIIEVKFYPEKEQEKYFNPGILRSLTSSKGPRSKGRKSSAGGQSWSSGTTTDISKRINVDDIRHLDSQVNCFYTDTGPFGSPSISDDFQEMTDTGEAGATVEGGHSSQQFQMSTEHFDVEMFPTTMYLYLKAPARVASGWGVFLKGKKKPYFVHTDKTALLSNAATLDDDQQFTIKPMDDISSYL